MRRATLKDIAHKMGLDVSTVSRVLNNDRALRIGALKRAEVLRTAEEMGYTPHHPARSLRMQRNFNIGYVFTEPEMGRVSLELPFSRYRLYGLEETLSARGYLLSLMRLPTDGPRAQEETLRRWRMVDGLVYSFFPPTPETAKKLNQAQLPAVVMDPPLSIPREETLSYVRSDREGGIRRALEYLHGFGHQRIAFVSLRTNTERWEGFRQAVNALELDPDPRLAKLFDGTARNLYAARAEGHQATRELLESGVAFSAVQAGSDMTAAGVIDALREAGRRVPEEVAVMGFDDIEGIGVPLFPEPFLSTVRDPNCEMGVRTAELLLAQIETDAKPQEIVLQPELTLRASV